MNITLWHKHQKETFYMIIRSLGVYNSFRMLNKPDSDHTALMKKRCVSLLNKLTQISSDPESDFLEKHLPIYFKETFRDEESMDKCKDWAMQNHQWRIFYTIFDFLDAKSLSFYVDSGAT